MSQIPNDLMNAISNVPSNQFGPSLKTVSKGALIAFAYPSSWARIPNIIHDPFPLLLVSDVWPAYVRGVNLHYLTFPYIKNILQGNMNNNSFSYFNIKMDNYVKNAFRMYVRVGMRRVKILNSEFLLKVLGTARSFAPGEIDNMKRYIQEQLNRQMNPRQATEKTKAVKDIISGGVDRNLTYPQLSTGPNAANITTDE